MKLHIRKFLSREVDVFKRMFGICDHRYSTDLVFCSSPATHKVVGRCWKCNKSKVIFRGTRKEWQKRLNRGDDA